MNIAAPKGINKVMYQDGDTHAIIKTIMYADKYLGPATSKQAKELKGNTPLQSAKNVWSWVKQNIKYVLDPAGEQYVKDPAVTFKDGYSDCKSRSLFQASLLKNLGIPFAYRFVYYPGDTIYKHVYIVAYINGREYPMDPDMPDFGIEKKPFVKKLDKQPLKSMSKIVYMAGPGEDPTALDLYKPVDQMTPFDMELAIQKQRDAIQKQLIERVSGIGCLKAERYNDRMEMADSMITIMKDNTLSADEKVSGIGFIAEAIERGEFNGSNTVSGIGNLSDRYRTRKHLHNRRMQKVYRRIKNKEVPQVGKISLKKIVKKAATAVKNVTKAVTKVATAPARLAAKGVLEVALPQMAPGLLYLFIKKPELIAKLPEKARRKRKRQEGFAKFVVKAIGMKEDHFMGIIRNGIMKKMGKSPEAVLAGMLKVPESEIGIIPVIMAVLPFITKIIGILKKVFGAKGGEGEMGKDDLPDQSDFAEWSTEESAAAASDLSQQDSDLSDTTSSDDRKTNKIC